MIIISTTTKFIVVARHRKSRSGVVAGEVFDGDVLIDVEELG